MERDSSIGRALLESRGYGSESRSLSFLFLDAKNTAAFMKGGMTDVRFCGTTFCIVDLMGDTEDPDRETERRTREKQKEITFQNGVDGNICSYFFSARA